jgi:hypothetical protein
MLNPAVAERLRPPASPRSPPLSSSPPPLPLPLPLLHPEPSPMEGLSSSPSASTEVSSWTGAIWTCGEEK